MSGRVAAGLAAVTVALMVAPAASAYTVEPTLTRVAGVETRCYTTAWPFRAEHFGGYFDATTRVISMQGWACGWIGRTLRGRHPAQWRMTLTAKSWHLFSHEVAHSLGYDHGESTVGADCEGWRLMRGLMRAAGVDRGYATALWRASAHRARCPLPASP
jgi:hypothetical protein